MCENSVVHAHAHVQALKHAFQCLRLGTQREKCRANKQQCSQWNLMMKITAL